MLKGANIYFLSIKWITFFKHLYSSMCCNGMQRAWLCKHNKEVRSIQASISRNSCTELSKTQLFPVIIVNQGVCQKVLYFEPPLPSCHTFSFFFPFFFFMSFISWNPLTPVSLIQKWQIFVFMAAEAFLTLY